MQTGHYECIACSSRLTTLHDACVPGDSVSLMPSGGVALRTLMVHPVLRCRCCTDADRLRTCACSSYNTAACTWSSGSTSAWRSSRKRSRCSNVEFKVALSSAWGRKNEKEANVKRAESKVWLRKNASHLQDHAVLLTLYCFFFHWTNAKMLPDWVTHCHVINPALPKIKVGCIMHWEDGVPLRQLALWQTSFSSANG